MDGGFITKQGFRGSGFRTLAFEASALKLFKAHKVL